jgi:adenine-specific DNA-methyltransferase
MARKKSKASRTSAKQVRSEVYKHSEATSLLRPEVGTQPQFRKKKPPVTYRFDSSLSPALDWDGQNSAREQGEAMIREILETDSLEAAKAAASRLKAISKPFLNWAGKAERLSFTVPTLPLFVHERLSTKAIIETLKGHRKDKQMDFAELFSDPKHSIADQVLKAYEYRDQWVNRLILGDSLVVTNSLLRYEGMGGQVQMIYMDPPYGVEFGSNFQPFVRKRDVSHGDDEDMTREPEMVRAYRDTWELGLHSYLTYLRDRLLLARELLHPSGSIFVQISDENLHRVREVMDEVFGAENFVVTVFLKKKGNQKGDTLEPINDYLLWFAKDKSRIKVRPLFSSKVDADGVAASYNKVEMPDGQIRNLTEFETEEIPSLVASGAKIFTADQLTSGGEFKTQLYDVEFEGRRFRPAANNSWKINEEAMKRLISIGRVVAGDSQIRFKKYLSDFPFSALTNLWDDLGGATDKIYVVQTTTKAVQRCILMTTDPGDLVLDPTCGSGTTAYVAEQWGRRWIAIDTSRVPLALTRQRIITATFPWYELKDSEKGPAGGLVYLAEGESRNPKATGPGIVPHIKLETIANDELPKQEVLVDRPEVDKKIVRVSGPFVVEAIIPTPMDIDSDGVEDRGTGEQYGSFVERMLEVLRHSPVLEVGGGRKVNLKNVRPPAKTLSLSAEAMVANGEDKPVAIVFGPENGAVSERLVHEAAKEANLKSYAHLYVIGFAIQPNARNLIDNCEAVAGIAATYVQATPDLTMGDLLKNMRSSQIFSVCGLPEIEVRSKAGKDGKQHQVELLGLDVFDPVTMEVVHHKGDDVPAWFLDTDYNDLCFHVCQAFFPRTGAWENLKKALRSTHNEAVWDHLAGATSAPFEPGEHRQVAVKVIDDRGNELVVVKKLEGEGK